MKPHLLLALFTGLVTSCKKEPTASNTNTPATSEAALTQTTPASPTPDPARISLWYHISDEEMKKRLGLLSADIDPFVRTKYPSQQLAAAGLPLPQGATIARPNHSFLLIAVPAYHEKVAALLGVKGIDSDKNPKDTDGDGLTDDVLEDPSKSR